MFVKLHLRNCKPQNILFYGSKPLYKNAQNGELCLKSVLRNFFMIFFKGIGKLWQQNFADFLCHEIFTFNFVPTLIFNIWRGGRGNFFELTLHMLLTITPVHNVLFVMSKGPP